MIRNPFAPSTNPFLRNTFNPFTPADKPKGGKVKPEVVEESTDVLMSTEEGPAKWQVLSPVAPMSRVKDIQIKPVGKSEPMVDRNFSFQFLETSPISNISNIWPARDALVREQTPMVIERYSEELWDLKPSELAIFSQMKAKGLDDISIAQRVLDARQLWELSAEEMQIAEQIKASGGDFSDAVLEIKNLRDAQWGTIPQKIVDATDEIGETAQSLGIWAAGIGAAGVGGKILKWLGEAIYGINIRPDTQEASLLQRAWTSFKEKGKVWPFSIGERGAKPRTKVQTALQAPGSIKMKIPFTKTVIDTNIKNPLSLVWTQKQIWDQARSIANEIRRKRLNPIFDSATETFDTDKLLKEAEKQIKKETPSRAKELLKWLEKVKKDIVKNKSITLRGLQDEKSAIDNLTPKKAFKGEEVANSYRAAKKFVADVYRKTIHDTIKKNYNVNSAKLYRDRANLNELADLWVKSRVQWGISMAPGGTNTLLTRLFDSLWTPITTTAGKSLYQIGELIDIPKQVQSAYKFVGRALQDPKKLKSLVRWLRGVTPAWFLEPNIWEMQASNRVNVVQDIVSKKGIFKNLSESERKELINDVDLDAQIYGVFSLLDLMSRDETTLREALPSEMVEEIIKVKQEFNLFEEDDNGNS